MADPGSEKGGGSPWVLGACPQDFLVNFSQLRGLFKVFGENKGGGGGRPGSATAHNLAFPLRLHLSNIRYSYTLTEMSLVETNDLNFVVKSSTVHLVGQAIVHITTEPSTTKLVAFTVLRHMST